MGIKALGKALVIGTSITLVLFGLGWLATISNLTELSYYLYWQGYVLGMLAPCQPVMVLGAVQCKVTTISIVAFYAGIPLGIAVYSLLALLPLSISGKQAR